MGFRELNDLERLLKFDLGFKDVDKDNFYYEYIDSVYTELVLSTYVNYDLNVVIKTGWVVGCNISCTLIIHHPTENDDDNVYHELMGLSLNDEKTRVKEFIENLNVNVKK